MKLKAIIDTLETKLVEMRSLETEIKHWREICIERE